MNKKSVGIYALVALMSLAAAPELYAKGGGGGGGGRSSFSGGGSSFGRSSGGGGGGFFKSPSPPPATVYRAPSPPPPSAPRPVVAAPVAPAPRPVQTAPTPAPSPADKKFFANDKANVPAFDKKAVDAQKHADSARAYQEAQTKKQASVTQIPSSTRSDSGSTQAPQVQSTARTYDFAAARAARERRAEELSTRIAAGQYRDREYRSRQIYGTAYSQPMPTYYGGGYSDSFSNPYFWYWLSHQSNQSERERFIYNHQSEIDPRRLEAMQSEYPELSAKLDRFKQDGVKPDPAYVPIGLAGNEDLVYGEDVASQAKQKASTVSGAKLLWLGVLALIFGSALYYLLFVVKWKVRETYA